MAEERYGGCETAQSEEGCRCVEEEPRELGWAVCGRFEESTVARHEEEVEEEIEGGRAKVDKGCEYSPVLYVSLVLSFLIMQTSVCRGVSHSTHLAFEIHSPKSVEEL